MSDSWTISPGTSFECLTNGDMMHQFDPTPFMFGTAITLVIGIAIGAGLVALCWTAAVNGPIERENARLAKEDQNRENELNRGSDRGNQSATVRRRA